MVTVESYRYFLVENKKISDTAGNAACEKLTVKIPNDKMVMRLRPAKKDWNECLIAGRELANVLPIEPFNVFYQTAKDGVGDTIKPRQ